MRMGIPTVQSTIFLEPRSVIITAPFLRAKFVLLGHSLQILKMFGALVVSHKTLCCAVLIVGYSIAIYIAYSTATYISLASTGKKSLVVRIISHGFLTLCPMIQTPTTLLERSTNFGL